MNDKMKLADGIYYIGKIDDRQISFHRTMLTRGTTYNSYLILADKPAVIDTVDPSFGKEFVDNLGSLIDPADIQYIISSHVEPDHSGAIPALASKAKNAKIVCTAKAEPILKDMFRLHSKEFLIVKDGDNLDIGGRILYFLETPYLHTEETMMTYEQKEGVLFPCDVFSSFIAAHEIFNDIADIDYDQYYMDYYRAIMAPHRPYVRKMLEKLKDLNIRIIAPSHGYIHRKDAQKYIDFYDKWSYRSEDEINKKVIILVSTMTGNTLKVAERIAKGIKELQINSEILNLKNTDKETIKTKILECDGFLAGSSTKYGDIVGEIETFLNSLKGENFNNKFAAAFGSYGWSGESIAHVDEKLEELGFRMINHRYLVKRLGRGDDLFPLRIRFLREDELIRAEEAGRVFAEQLLQ